MSLGRQLKRGLQALANRTTADRDVTDEVQHYLEQATAAFVAKGLSAEDAQRAARLEMGNVTGVREQVREYGWENVIRSGFADLHYGARQLRKNPGFATTAVLILALGIGASTAIFSAVNPILFKPLPYPDAGRILMIWDNADGSRQQVTFGTYRELAERNRLFEALAVMEPWQPTISAADQPERLDGQRVSADYFRVLGVSPLLGRSFEASEDRPGGPKVAIISAGLWKRRFGGEQTIAGGQITLDGDSYTVIGVMPASFENVLAPPAEIWRLLQYDPTLPLDGPEWGHHLRMVGRLRPGVSTSQGRRDLDAIARSPLREFPRAPWAAAEQGFVFDPLQEDVTRGVKPALLAVLGAVALVLLIGCVNVTNLLLARGVQRRSEFAMRVALGAGRTRLVRQLLTESLLLAFIGGVLGIVVAEIGVKGLIALSPAELPRVGAIQADGPVFAFTLGITTLIGLVVGLIPAAHVCRSDPHAGLQQSSLRTAGGHQLTRRALVVAEVALALVLLVSAGLLLRSLQRWFAVDPGFDGAHVLTMQVQTSGHRFDDDRTTYRFFEQALEAVRRVPGVTTAGFTSQLPLSGDFDSYGVHFESSPIQRDDRNDSAFRYAVSPGYIETMHIPLRRGRLFDERDRAGSPMVALINESFAKRELPGLDPIGQRLRIGPKDAPLHTIVGVVGDVKQMSLALSETDAVYITPSQWQSADRVMSLVVRTRGNGAVLIPAIKQAIWSVDKDQPVVRVATMDDLLAATAAERRFAMILFEAFALVALVLAATGIYGVLSGSVSERMREMGVRSALGASRGNILTLVVRQGMALTGLGIVLGLAGAVVASQAMAALLFGVSRLDPITYFGVITLLLGVSAAACYLPARRAAQVDPAIMLRAD